MIRLLVVVLGFAPSLPQHNESYQSFVIDNREVVWAHVYEDQKSVSDLSSRIFNFLKTHAWVRNVRYDGADIVADVENYKVDYKRYGAKFMNISNVVRTGRWFGKLRVMFKDGKYRVIVYGLHYIARQPARTAGKVSLEAHDISGTLSEFALDDLRMSFKKSRFKNLDVIHMNLKDLFNFSNKSLADQEW
jgi:hypothetical protein